jgi:hypothetical protein
MINERVAFGVVASVCVLLAVVVRFSGLNDSLPSDPSNDDFDQADRLSPR